MTRSATARAKINLTLHVGRKIADPHDPFFGYHPLDSLVVFADIGDKLTINETKNANSASKTTHSLDISGPFSGGLKGESDNLIIRALNAANAGPHHVNLVKRLPVSAGIGGGSANAAAVLRLLGINDPHIAVGLGADVPVCLRSKTAHMTGIGEDVTPMPALGNLHAVLVNPGISVSTADIFRAFDSVDNIRETPRPQMDGGDLLAHALDGRNDLQPIAIAQAPVIQEVLDALTVQADCQLSRMSGSGATCFGIYPTAKSAKSAAETLKTAHPNWWIVPTQLGDD